MRLAVAGRIHVFKKKRGGVSARKTGPHEYGARPESGREKWCRIPFVFVRWFYG